jgi:hypothetical protein
MESPKILVGWLDDRSHEDRAARCAIPVDIILGQWHTADVDVTASPCWNRSATVQHIGINVDADRHGVVGVFHVSAIELLK